MFEFQFLDVEFDLQALQFRKQALISDDEFHDESSDLVLMFRFQV